MATIKIMSAGAVQAVLTALAAEFERDSGHTLDLNFGTAGAMLARIKGGEKTDIMALGSSGIAELEKLGQLVPGSVIDLGRTVSAIVARDGTPAPDLSTPEAFMRMLRDTPSFAYTDPKAGGTGGIMFAALLEKLGLADEVNRKAVLCKGGHHVSETVAEGGAALGITFISEALTVKGVAVIGPLPGDLYHANTYTAAVAADSKAPEAAAAFLRYQTAPQTRPRWIAAGLEPAFP